MPTLRILMTLLLLSLLAGCSSGRHETMKLDSYHVGLNVPEEWVRERATNDWRMPDKGAWHFRVMTIRGDGLRPAIARLKQLASLLEQPDAEIPVELCRDLRGRAKTLLHDFALTDPENRELVPPLVGFVGGTAALLAQVEKKTDFDRAKLAKDVQLWIESLEKASGSEHSQAAALVKKSRGQMATDTSNLTIEEATVSELPAKKVTLPGQDPRVFFFVDTSPDVLVFEFHDALGGKVTEQIDAVMKSVKIGYEKSEVE